MTSQEKIKTPEKRINKSISNIDDRKKKKNFSIQEENQDITKDKIELRYKARQEQLDLLTSSLTSSSRISNWISRIRAIFK